MTSAELRAATADGVWLSRKQAAHYLSQNGCPISESRLSQLACNFNRGKGPAFFRSGWKCVRYLKSDLDTWATKRRIRYE